MTIAIVDYQLPYDTHNLYDVTFFDDEIHTLVTHSPDFVDNWISETESLHCRRLRRLIVGLDVEWRPNFNRNVVNPVATIQLCVGRRCLIFQLIHASGIPRSLSNFLSNPDYTFVGVGVKSDSEKLLEDYELRVAKTVDLRVLAVEQYGRDIRNVGLKELVRVVLGKEIVKPRRITMSRWDQQWLTAAQVEYACIDAFVSFEIGKILNASGI